MTDGKDWPEGEAWMSMGDFRYWIRRSVFAVPEQDREQFIADAHASAAKEKTIPPSQRQQKVFKKAAGAE